MRLNSEILHVGPNFNRRQGGIAYVIKLYSSNSGIRIHFSEYFENKILMILFFPFSLIMLILKLLILKINLVHIHSSASGSFYRNYLIFLIVKTFRIPIVIHIHSGRFLKFYATRNYTRKHIRHFLTSSSAVIVLTDLWKEKFQEKFNNARIYTLGNPVIIPEKNKSTSPNQKILNVVYLGKIFEPKGVFELLDVIEENQVYFKEKLRFTLAGKICDERIYDYINLSKEGLIELPGYIQGIKKENLLKKANIFILPSYSEGLPIVILEAMAHALPVIATKVGGIPEVVEDGITGKLIEPKSKREVFKALDYYLRNKEQVSLHGNTGYESVQKFDINKILNELALIYHSIE